MTIQDLRPSPQDTTNAYLQDILVKQIHLVHLTRLPVQWLNHLPSLSQLPQSWSTYAGS